MQTKALKRGNQEDSCCIHNARSHNYINKCIYTQSPPTLLNVNYAKGSDICIACRMPELKYKKLTSVKYSSLLSLIWFVG